MGQLDVTSAGVEAMSAHVADVEARLSDLEAAFAATDASAIEACAQQLQRSLAESLVAFRKAEHDGVHPLNEELINRLKLAQARIQSHQVAVHRATSSFDRTLGVLFPREESTYTNPSASPAAKALKAYGA